MRVLIVCGSANPNGTTASMCRSAAESVWNAGSIPELVLASEMTIGHCTGCGCCKDGECAEKDDMARLLDAVERSDILILASPIHFSGPSSLTKTVMDRFQPYWYRKERHGGKMAAMLCGGSPEPRFHCAVYIMRAFSITVGMEWCGHLEVPGTDRDDFEVPKDDIDRFVRDLVRS